jgi:integrase
LERRDGSVRLVRAAFVDPTCGAGRGQAADPEEQRAVTTDLLEKLLSIRKSDRLVNARDAALLLVAFASGGRRCSEVAGLRVEQLVEEAPVPADPADPRSPSLPCVSIVLGRTKTGQADEDHRVLLVGLPVEALNKWLLRADITKGPIFRAIDRWGGLEEMALTPQAVNLILKRRIALAGLDPREFSAHGLRAGYLTEGVRRGVALPAAMQQSQHRSVQQSTSYYNDAERLLGWSDRAGGSYYGHVPQGHGWLFISDRSICDFSSREFSPLAMANRLSLVEDGVPLRVPAERKLSGSAEAAEQKVSRG